MTALACLTETVGNRRVSRGIVDVFGLTTAYLKILPIENIIKILKNAERVATGRHKGFHVVNVPAAFSYLLNACIQHAPEKMRQRVKI